MKILGIYLLTTPTAQLQLLEAVIWNLNPFATGNPFLGTKLLEFSIGRGSGALKGLN